MRSTSWDWDHLVLVLLTLTSRNVRLDLIRSPRPITPTLQSLGLGCDDFNVKDPHSFGSDDPARAVIQEIPGVPSEAEEEGLNELVPEENKGGNDDARDADHLLLGS